MESIIVFGTVTRLTKFPGDGMGQGNVEVTSANRLIRFRIDRFANRGLIIDNSNIMQGDIVLMGITPESKLTHIQILVRTA